MIKLLHLVYSSSGLSVGPRVPRTPRANSRIGAIADLCLDLAPETGSQLSSEQAELDLCLCLKAEGSQRLGFQVWNLEKSPAPSSRFCDPPPQLCLSCRAWKRSSPATVRLAGFPHSWAQPGRWSEPIFKVDTRLRRACWGVHRFPFIYKVTACDSVSRRTWILFQQERLLCEMSRVISAALGRHSPEFSLWKWWGLRLGRGSV